MKKSSLAAILREQKQAQQTRLKDYALRRQDLLRLKAAMKRHKHSMVEAIQADFGQRSGAEILLSEYIVSQHEIDYMLKHLRSWMRPRQQVVDWRYWPARSWIQYQPLGVVGIIGPWNYPVNLILAPLAAALAAGNHAMLKPSEFTPATAAWLKTMLAETFPTEQVSVVEGDAEVAAEFSALPFDHLFFTGSTTVGRLVMAAAAKNLTPVTLELGGKSPVIIDTDYALSKAAQSVATGKFFNAGQTCIAPDYIMLVGQRQTDFVNALRKAVQQRYKNGGLSAYTCIVNQRQHQRLTDLLKAAEQEHGQVLPLLNVEPEHQNMLLPTVVTGVDDKSAVMQEEIFGPILPVFEVADLEQAIAWVNQRPRPLALYYFGHRRERQNQVLHNTVSGGVTVNDTLAHFAQPNLPFGGVGESGMGQYHGYDGFLTFSKKKPVFKQARWSALNLLKAPYTGIAGKIIQWLSK